MGWHIKKHRNHNEASTHNENQEHRKRTAPEKGGWINRRIKGAPWIVWGVALSVAAAVSFSSLYGIFRASAGRKIQDPVENSRNIAWLVQNCYLLYRDLYNSQNGTSLNYEELYLEIEEEYRSILKTNSYEELLIDDLRQNDLRQNDAAQQNDTVLSSEETPEGAADAVQRYIDDLDEDSYWSIVNGIGALRGSFETLEERFSALNSNYDYMIEDTVTGKKITNMSTEDRNRSLYEYRFYLKMVFDDLGNMTVSDDIRGENSALVRKYANEAVRENHWINYRIGAETLDGLLRVGTVKTPKNCTVTYCISKEAWNDSIDRFYTLFGGNYSADLLIAAPQDGSYLDLYTAETENAYRDVGMSGVMVLFMAAVFAMGGALPVLGDTKPWKKDKEAPFSIKICSLPFELLLGFGVLLLSLSEEMFYVAVHVASGSMAGSIKSMAVVSTRGAQLLAYCLNLLLLSALFFGCWYLGVSFRAVREMGVRNYIRKRSLVYRFFPFMKEKAAGFYGAVAHMDLTKNAHRTILKIVIVNAVILAGICFLWVGGISVVLVYSLILYLILRKYISDLQEKYQLLLKTANQIADGNLNAYIGGDWGVFDPFKIQMIKIEKGFQKAVDEEVKSQRMKADLITNVSHDLKTPLTAIITYVNLLKGDNVTEEQRKEYLDTLERKSLRLKVLIEDLFEVSKASSNNITLNIMDVDIMNLVKQVEFEMSDKLKAANLDVRMNLTDEKVILPLDSQKTFRIYENLFGNIAKYAMPGTRVYVNGFRTDDTAVITMKNISAQEITVDSTELTERFVRGDASRNTEGSGLGLAIAKSFTAIQNGELTLEVDGDLFKVTTTWHIEE